MAPTKTNTGHGPLFDSFPSRPGSLHGGAKFDEGFNLQEKGAPKGPNFDEWGTPAAASTAHGPVWDEFGWKDMPDIHGGLLYDDGFQAPTAHATSRGPLFDLFEPSSQVKFIYDGHDSEGIVDHVREDGIVMVRPRAGGNAVEVGLEQFLAYKSPSLDNATTTAPESTADSPSARDTTAHGGGILAGPSRTELGGDLGPIIDSVSGGPGNPDARTEIPEDWSTVDHLKSLLSGDDVAKAGGMKSPFHSRYSHQAFPGDEHRHFADGVHIGTSSGSGGETVKHAWAHAPGTSRAAMVNGPKLGKFPSHEAAHVAIAEHHMDTHKSATSPLDVLKSGMGFGGDSAKLSHEVRHVNDVDFSHHVLYMHPQHGQRSGLVSHSKSGSSHVRLKPSGRVDGPSVSVKRSDISHIHQSGATGIEGDRGPGYHKLEGHVSRFKGLAKTRTSLPSELMKSYSEFTGTTAIAKDVTSAQTAVQGESNAAPFAGAVGSGSYCPECREKKGKLTDDGRCPDCNTALTAHEDKVIKREKGDGNGSAESSEGKGVAGKSLLAGLDVLKVSTITGNGYHAVGNPVGDGPNANTEARHYHVGDDLAATHRSTLIGRSRHVGMGRFHAESAAGDDLGEHGGMDGAHRAIVAHHKASLGKTSSAVEDLRKAFGAAGDNVAGGQTVTSDGDPGTRGQQKGQAKSDPPDVPMDERAHPDSDHNSETTEAHSAGTTCPHCGQPLAELDAKTDQGAPAHAEPGGDRESARVAHKCVEGFLDTLKSASDEITVGPGPSVLEQLRDAVAA